jgi:microsomal dipeptidase-like Zn-dependent dipeptidase
VFVALAERRGTDARVVGAILGINGAYPLDDDLANFDALERAGYRVVGLAHFFDNAFAGSAYGTEKGALTERVAFDVSQPRAITQALVDAGLTDEAIRKVLGENARRLLAAVLP